MLIFSFGIRKPRICALRFTVKRKRIKFKNNWCQLRRRRIKGVVYAVGWSSI